MIAGMEEARLKKIETDSNRELVVDADYEVRSMDTMCMNESQVKQKWYHHLQYAGIGIVFGIAFTKAEVISWFRIQEMFRLQSFHMYGVMATAIAVGIISIWLIKKYKVKTIYGEDIIFHQRKFNKGQIIGGLLFGFGWAMTGACPGPLFAQIGAGFVVVTVVLISAIAGTWVYGYFRERLPH
jgi:uncharacterized membrane protein YedE/YeeE